MKLQFQGKQVSFKFLVFNHIKFEIDVDIASKDLMKSQKPYKGSSQKLIIRDTKQLASLAPRN